MSAKRIVTTMRSSHPDRPDPHRPDPSGSDSGRDPDVDTWVSSLHTDQAAEERSRRWWLTRQAREQGSLAGIATDLARLDATVVVHLRDGQSHRGEIRVAGSDFCTISTQMGHDVLIAYDAIASVKGMPGAEAVFGDEVPTNRGSMRDALADLAETNERVRLRLGYHDRVMSGSLMAVGTDVATVKNDSGDWVYVVLASVVEVSLPESG